LAHTPGQRINEITPNVPKNSMRSCAVSTVVFVRNRTYNRAVGLSGGDQLTMLTLKAPDAFEFRVFACFVFVEVPDKLRRKLGKNAFRGIIVGYRHDGLGYRVYNPATRRITTSVYVVSRKPRWASAHAIQLTQ
jgi:hypothetical protein